MPEKYQGYTECFIGGGALFFAVQPEEAYLSDINFPLILTYTAVRDDVERLISKLQVHADNHNKKYYLERRAQHITRHSAATMEADLETTTTKI